MNGTPAITVSELYFSFIPAFARFSQVTFVTAGKPYGI
jgi:hypothetical protein